MERFGEINGDENLGFKEKLRYFFRNLIVNLKGSRISLPSRRFNPDPRLIESISGRSVPRWLTDEFIRQFLKTEFADPSINVLDVGGGSGYLRNLLEKCELRGGYTCVDIVKNPRFNQWSTVAFKTDFIESSIESLDAKAWRALFDLVVTICALEHMLDDELAIQQCQTLVKDRGLQIHIVPASAGLFLYLFHGYRQYNNKRLRNLFPDASLCQFVKLGGLGTFLCHFLLVTICENVLRISVRSNPKYNTLASWAISLDHHFPYPASMYAVIVRNR